MRWMKLEPVIQSKVSQKGKYQYSVLTRIYGIYFYSAVNIYIYIYIYIYISLSFI